MNLTTELRKLGFSRTKRVVPSSYNYRADDGVWICTVWKHNTDRDVAFAHVNLSNSKHFALGQKVRVVLITREAPDAFQTPIQTARADEQEWRVAYMIPPTNGYSRFRAVLVRDRAFSDGEMPFVAVGPEGASIIVPEDFFVRSQKPWLQVA